MLWYIHRMKKSEWPTLSRFEELLHEGQALGMTTSDNDGSDDADAGEPLCDLLQSLIEACKHWETKAQSALRSRAPLEDYLTLQKDALAIYAELPSRETINEVVRNAKEWHQEALNVSPISNRFFFKKKTHTHAHTLKLDSFDFL